MRFRFADETNPSEAAARRSLRDRMDAWWAAFARKAPAIEALFARKAQWDLVAFMREHLDPIDKRLMWEFGPGLGAGEHQLVITPENRRFLRPLVADLLSRAPRDTRFEFYPARMPVGTAVAGMVKARTGLTLDGWTASLAPSDDFGIDITFVAPGDLAASDRASTAAFVAAEALLGEETVDSFVDVIEVARTVPAGMTAGPLDQLAEAVRALLDRQRARLDDRPLLEMSETTERTLLELKPTQSTDYAHAEDLFVAKTASLPMWKRAHSGTTFDSRRFSRCGETFCFLKLDGIEEPDPAGFSDKAEIEDAVDAALKPAGLGVFVGGGTGLRYSYIDLALLDVERAVPVLRDVLRSGRLPKRSWLQFFDSGLQGEWVGVWDDSPPPPGLPE